MCKSFYNFLITAKLRTIDFFEMLDIAEKYGKVHTNVITNFDVNNCLSLPEISEGTPCFINVGATDIDTYAIFYENLLITLSLDRNANDRIVRIYIKRPEDAWMFKRNEEKGGYDILHPDNVNGEVYINYEVSVLRLDRCVGEDYKSGAWNKMFYRTINSLCDKVKGFTEISQLKQAYGK